MIAESKISERISPIEEAGNIAANEAKLTRIGKELDKANKISQVLETINLKQYIGDKLYSKVKEEMAKSIQEYKDAKTELEEKKSSKETAMKDVKDDNKKDEKGKEKVLESKSKKKNTIFSLAKPKQIEDLFKKHSKDFEIENTEEKRDEEFDNNLYNDMTYKKEGDIKYYYRLGRIDYPEGGLFHQLIQKERPFPQI
jgi:hypothetical protein